VAKQREMEQEKAAPCGRERAANQVLRERASTLFGWMYIVIVMRAARSLRNYRAARRPEESKRRIVRRTYTSS
jgi:hypothetical protein